jgi:hypothetical protein
MYTVSTIQLINDQLAISEIGDFADIRTAMKAARKLAKGATDCEGYGPSSFCYVGHDITAVVAKVAGRS